MLHHRHKQRILGTIITLIVFVLCFDLFFLMRGHLSLETDLLITFGLGIILLTIYHIYNYEHCKEPATLINNLTQIYFGALLILGVILILIMRLLFNISMINTYLILSLVMIALIFATLGAYDNFLEEHMGRKFPINAPSPRTRRKKQVRGKIAR